MTGTTVLQAILSVFTSIGTWISTAVTAFIPMFWEAPSGSATTGNLTFLGVLAVAGLGISVCFLMIGIIQKFIHFRG